MPNYLWLVWIIVENIAIQRTIGTLDFMLKVFKLLSYFIVIVIICPNFSLADSSAAKNLKLAYDVFIGDLLAGSADFE